MIDRLTPDVIKETVRSKGCWSAPYSMEGVIRNHTLPFFEAMDEIRKTRFENFLMHLSGKRISVEEIKNDLIRYLEEAELYHQKETAEKEP